MTQYERQRCLKELQAMSTGDLKKMVALMEKSNPVERLTLEMAIVVLAERRVKLENLKLGMSDAILEQKRKELTDARPARCD